MRSNLSEHLKPTVMADKLRPTQILIEWKVPLLQERLCETPNLKSLPSY